MSEALEALYQGDGDRASSLLGPDERLSVFEAAAFGRTDRLRSLLLADSANARAFSEDGFTALHLAAFGRQEEAARLLIEHGADVNAISSSSIARVTPLGTAAFVRSVPLARILLEAGADPSAGAGSTPLQTAEANGDDELIALLRLTTGS